ncbi:MAG: hypothetical protein M3Y69_05840 [Verrucomicrobiota bacterium]|nr:hypothetical protein [Verrucomicrobiota bacterium]
MTVTRVAEASGTAQFIRRQVRFQFAEFIAYYLPKFCRPEPYIGCGRRGNFAQTRMHQDRT